MAEDHEQAALLLTTAADAGIALAMFYAGEVYEDIPQRSRKMGSDSRKYYFYYMLADEYLTAEGEVELAKVAKIRIDLIKMVWSSATLKEVGEELAEWRKAHP